MFSKEKYGRILVPMVTPFKENQEVDYDAAVSIADRLVETKMADSLVLSGTAGEFFTMTAEERIELFTVLKKKMGSKIPMLAGVGAASTIETVRLAKAAQDLGFDLLMVVSPYYTKPNQQQLYEHYRAVAASVKIPMLVYNIPIFTGVNVEPETVARLAKIDNIVGIKEEAELNPKQITAFLNATPEDFIIYNGDDTMILECYAQGAERIGGVISGQSHLVGDRIKKMIDAFQACRVAEAAAMQRSFFGLFRIMGQNNRVNPCALIKKAMELIGYRSGLPRLPLTPASPEETEKIKAIMQEMKIL